MRFSRPSGFQSTACTATVRPRITSQLVRGSVPTAANFASPRATQSTSATSFTMNSTIVSTSARELCTSNTRAGYQRDDGPLAIPEDSRGARRDGAGGQAFLAGAFLAVVFLAAVFLAGAFLAAAFLAGAFLAAVFLAGVDFAAVDFAGAFFAVFLAGRFVTLETVARASSRSSSARFCTSPR